MGIPCSGMWWTRASGRPEVPYRLTQTGPPDPGSAGVGAVGPAGWRGMDQFNVAMGPAEAFPGGGCLERFAEWFG